MLFENAHECGLYEFSHIYQAMLMGIMGVESSVRIVLCTVYDENGDVFPLSPYYMRLQMVFVDSWSAVMIVLTVVQIIISVLAIKNKNNKKVVVE